MTPFTFLHFVFVTREATATGATVADQQAVRPCPGKMTTLQRILPSAGSQARDPHTSEPPAPARAELLPVELLPRQPSPTRRHEDPMLIEVVACRCKTPAPSTASPYDNGSCSLVPRPAQHTSPIRTLLLACAHEKHSPARCSGRPPK